MKKPTQLRPIIAALVFIVLVISACTNSKEAPPFPVAESEFIQPNTKTFAFSEPDTLVWTTKDPSSLKQLPTKKFSWDKLPSKPIDFGLPVSIKGKTKSKPFSLDSLPFVPFSMDSLPKAKLNIKVIALGEPEIVDAAVLGPLPNATRGVMSGLGVPGTPRTVFKDSKGILWIGFDGNIARYDSENLQIYGLEQGLKIQAARTLYEDTQGRLWVGGDAVTLVIDFEAQLIYELSGELPKTGTYGIIEVDGKFWMSNINIGYDIIDLEEKTIHQLTQEDGLLGEFNITPFQDKTGLIWLSSNSGVNIIDLKSGKNRQLTTENGLPGAFVSSFYEDKSDRLWISSQPGAVMLEADRTSMSQYLNSEWFEDMNGVSGIHQDAAGLFWIGGVNGMMYQLDENKGSVQRFNVANTPSTAMLYIVEDGQGQIWVGVPQGGLYKIDARTGRPGNFTTTDGLTSNAVWNTLEARDGKIWIGTYEGIDVYDPETKTIKHLSRAEGLLGDRNSRLRQDSKGRIWSIGNRFGVSIIDPVKETIQQLTSLQGLETDQISGVAEVTEGISWLGGSEGELISVDMDNAILKFILPTVAEQAFQNNVVLKDNNDHIWIAGVGSGIQRINQTTNERVFLTTEGGLISNTVYSIAVDDDNNIWAAMDLGVQYINIATNEITSFTTKEGLAASDVYAIAVHNGDTYTGTSRGLTILRTREQSKQQKPLWSVKVIGKAQGLNFLDFSENSFTFDRNNKFWAGVQGAQLTVMDEIVVDTIAAPTFITGIKILDQKQQFYDKEVVHAKRVGLDSIFLPNSDTPMVSEVIEKDTNYLATHEITWKTIDGPYNIPVQLTLPHNQNYLSFSYNGLYYANPDQVVYRYILEGIDKNWSPISQETVSENYRDLAPGEYSFKVASKGFSDVWSQPTSFNFSILPPWWQTWWAYLLFALIFGTFIWSLAQYRSRWLKKENRVLEERVSHRTIQLKNKIDELKATQSQLIHSEKMASLGELTAGIAHEIQNPLNFVNNFSEVNRELIEELKEEKKKNQKERDSTLEEELLTDIDQNLEKISHHGNRADSIVKGMLHHSRASSGEKEPIDINVLADEYLRLAYHGLRAKDKTFNATLKTDFDDKIGKIEIIPQDMGRVILNLITNAFHAVQEKSSLAKASEGSKYEPTVSVITKKVGNTIEIQVKDNGNGIPKKIIQRIFEPFFTTKPTGQGTGLGLSLSYDIVKAQGGELKVETKEGKGTTFIIQLTRL